MLHHRNHGPGHRDLRGGTPRRRVIALVIGAGGMLAVLVLGVVLSIASAMGVGSTGQQHQTADGVVISRPGCRSTDNSPPATTIKTRVSAAPSVSAADLASMEATIALPAATATGPGGVATGYPQSTEGAIAQLMSIHVALLSQSRDRQVSTLRSWSKTSPVNTSSAARSAQLPFLEAQGAQQSERIPTMALAVGANEPWHHNVCLALAERNHASSRLTVHCASMVGHWGIQSSRTMPGLPRSFSDTSSAREAGFRRLQGAATPDQR